MSAEKRSRLQAWANMIDNVVYFIDTDQAPDLLRQAEGARMAWGLFAEELAAHLLVAGHDWPAIANALELPDDWRATYVEENARRRAEALQAPEVAQ